MRDKSKVAGDSFEGFVEEIYEQDVKAHGDFPSVLHKAIAPESHWSLHTLN